MTRSGKQRAWYQSEWVIPFLKQYKRPLILAIFLGLLTAMFAAGLMFTSGYLIASASEVGATILTIHLPLVFVRVFGVGKPFLQYFERLTSHNWVLRMTSLMRAKLYTLLEKNAVLVKQRYRTGDVLGLLSEDIGHLQNLYLRVVLPTVIGWLLYLCVVIAAGVFSLWLALVLLVLLGITVVVVPLVSLLVNGAKQTRRKHLVNELYAEVTDNILGVSDWIFSGRSKDFIARYEATDASLNKLDRSLQGSTRRRNLLLHAIFGVSIVIIVVWAAQTFGSVAAGGAANWIVAFALLFFPLIESFGPLSAAAVESTTYLDSVKRLDALTEQSRVAAGTSHDASSPSVQVESKTARTVRIDDPYSDSQLDPAPDPEKAFLMLDLRSVSFTYPQSDQTILDAINLTIPQQQKIAILGRSGSGKTTLAGLLRGDLVPSQGTVCLAGVPTAGFGDKIAQYIGVIQQQTYLFNMSLIDNIRIGNEDATEAEVWDAVEKVGLGAMVTRLPKQLNTMVDEAGLRFSGGERHRIALARVLVSKVPIVILDEPMVALDPVTEHALMKTILETLADKTLIMITHHLQEVQRMDRVIFIEDGRISIDGTPEELAQTNPYYQKLLAFDQGLDSL